MALGKKFTAITASDEMTRWLGTVIQEKVAKENAGLVEISVGHPAGKPPSLTVHTSGSRYGFKFTVETVQAPS